MNATLRRARLAAFAAAQAAPKGGPLAVRDLKVFRLREPVSGRRYSLVKIETQAGPVGWGECGRAADEEVAAVKARIVGRPATGYEVLRRELGKWPGLSSAINMALLDILGKAAKAPVYQVLGGPTRNQARVMMPLAPGDDPSLGRELNRGRQAGYRAFGVPLPPPAHSVPAFVAATRQRLEALRAEAGDCDFVLDGAAALAPGLAGNLAADLERFHLLWFDEPCALANAETLRKISRETVTPLGLGRHVESNGGFQDLLRQEVIDVLRPDLAQHPLSQVRRAAALAETYYVAVAPFHNGGPLATAAALHLAASLPNFFVQQIPFPEAERDRKMRAEIAGADVEVVRDGFASLPAGPGLGVAVNEAAIERYQERAA